ncbi:MAG: hypothetical protein HOC23_22430 [Halieaceae bacterium]|jgi:hypothetical protein|nr:hypothetical protein [Halieaceae bacterium]
MLDIPANLHKTELEVLAWTDHFFGPDFLKPFVVPNRRGGDIRMSFTTDRDRLPDVDAVWFHGPSIQEMPNRSEKTQPWVLMSMESDVNYPYLKNPLVRAYFDVLMTYRLDSDVPCIYPNWNQYGDFLEQPPSRSGASEGALAAYIASNPVAYRDQYIAELMHHIAVDSLGSCLNNRRIDTFVEGGWSEGAWSSILDVMKQYKFYLAFENSQTIDYVTERVFHALNSGTVPVYLGASNIREFMPDPAAVIIASEFDSPALLARYLRQLDTDNDAYQQHLAWKNSGYSAQFKQLLNLGSTPPQQRLAVKLAHGCDRSCTCGGRLREAVNRN